MIFLVRISSLVLIFGFFGMPRTFCQSHFALPIEQSEVIRMFNDTALLVNPSTVKCKLDSEHTLYLVRHSDGSTSQSLRILDLIEGTKYSFYSDWQIKQLIEFHHGCEEGIQIKWHGNGQIQEHGHMICLSSDTLITDSFFLYDDITGEKTLVTTQTTALSVKDGKWFYYNENGRQIKFQIWFQGELKEEVLMEDD